MSSEAGTGEKTPRPRLASVRRRRLPYSFEIRDPAALVTTGWQRAVAILFGLSVCALFLASQPELRGGLSEAVWNSIGTGLGITRILEILPAVLVAACAAAIAQRVGMWNLGIQGQLIFGAWFASLVAFTFPGLPGPLLIPALLLVGMIGGALVTLAPALARAYLSVNEIITTLMLNFIALLWLSYWATGPWLDVGHATGTSGGALYSRQITPNAFLGSFELGAATVSLGLVIALGLAVVLWALFRYSHYGFRTALTASGEDTGRYAGVSTQLTRLSALLFSGAIGGLAGALILVDRVHSFSTPVTADNAGFWTCPVSVDSFRLGFKPLPLVD